MMLNDDGTVFEASSSVSVPSSSDSASVASSVDYGAALEQITVRLDALSDKADFFVGVTQVFVVFVVMTLLYRLFKIFF